MSEILRSAVAGFVPTVAQLETTVMGMGYNRADAKLYGLKVIGGSKTVELLNNTGTGIGYTHPGYSAIDQTLTGATVLATLKTDTIGSVIEVTTRTLTAADLGIVNYWEKELISGSYYRLKPASYSSIYEVNANIYNADYAIYCIQNSTTKTYLTPASLVSLNKTSYGSLQLQRYGNVTGNALQATNIIGTLEYLGYTGINFMTGARIQVSAGSSNWSASENGTNFKIEVAKTGTTTIYNRIMVTDAGNVVIHEDGDGVDFRVEGNSDQNLFLVKGSTNKIGISTGGSVDTKFHVQCPSDWGQELVKLEQADADQAFIDFVGTSAANASNNISTYNASGSVVGPKGQSSTEDYWRYEGMILNQVNGVDAWQPYFSFQAGT